MNAPSLEALQAAALSLSAYEQRKLFDSLRIALYPDPTTNPMVAAEIRDKRFQDGLTCPRCEDRKVIKHGTYDGNQRYLCKACNSTFSDHTGSPLARLREPGKWQVFLECLIDGRTLRESAPIVGVHYVTLFYWRHKVMKALKTLPPARLKGLIESDETYQLESQKGSRCIEGRPARQRGGRSKTRGITDDQVCTVVARDRDGATFADVAGFGQLSCLKAKTILAGVLADATVLCSDSASAYMKLAKDLEIEHIILNASKKIRKRGIYHIQNVNGYHSRLKEWLGCFKGVATKYLNSYQSLFDFIDRTRSYRADVRRKDLLMTANKSFNVPSYKAMRLVRFPDMV